MDTKRSVSDKARAVADFGAKAIAMKLRRLDLRYLALLSLGLGGCTGEQKIWAFLIVAFFVYMAIDAASTSQKESNQHEAAEQRKIETHRMELEDNREQNPDAFEFNQAVPSIYAGMVFSGHPDIEQLIHLDVGCTEKDFVFMREGGWSEVGKIPRDAITDLEVLNRSRVETDSRFTLTRVALLGVFALAVPKKTTKNVPSYMLQVGILHKGIRTPTYFRSSKGLAGLNELMKYFADNMQSARRDEMKDCQFCAESIKVAAVKCRYCGSMLGLEELRL